MKYIPLYSTEFCKCQQDRHHEMKAPKVQDSLSWRKRKSQFVVAEGAEIVAAAASSLNKFANDGSFMRELVSKVSGNSDVSTTSEGNTVAVQNKMSANQLAAKAMQLRLKGKNDEADKLMVRPLDGRVCFIFST